MMRQVRSDKSNVAWFALAECISRGEKERALGVYRLLSHSFEDSALKLQLEGDILWSFRDEGALKKYQAAVEMYKHEGRSREAIAILEHMVKLSPESLMCRNDLVQQYVATSTPECAGRHAVLLIEIAARQQEFLRMREIVDQLERLLEPSSCARLYQQYVISALQYEEVPHNSVLVCMKKAINFLVSNGQRRALQQFVSKIQALNVRYYQQAHLFIEDDKDAN